MKPDLRVVKTRDAITRTFKAMICEMDAGRITVKELAERARIHRQTFYLHYASMEDLFQEVVWELVEKLSAMWGEEEPVDHTEAHRRFFSICAGLEKHEEKMLCDASYEKYYQTMFRVGTEQNRIRFNSYGQWPKEVQDILLKFELSNLLEFYRHWVAGGKKMPVRDLTVIADLLLYSGMSGFINSFPHSSPGAG